MALILRGSGERLEPVLMTALIAAAALLRCWDRRMLRARKSCIR